MRDKGGERNGLEGGLVVINATYRPNYLVVLGSAVTVGSEAAAFLEANEPR